MSRKITCKLNRLKEVIRKILVRPELTPRLRSFFGSLVRIKVCEETKEQVIIKLEKNKEAKELFVFHNRQLARAAEDDTGRTRVYDEQGDLI